MCGCTCGAVRQNKTLCCSSLFCTLKLLLYAEVIKISKFLRLAFCRIMGSYYRFHSFYWLSWKEKGFSMISVLLQVQANRGWSTSASTSAFPATSACLCASTTYQSDCVLASSPSSKRSGKHSFLFSPPPHSKQNK